MSKYRASLPQLNGTFMLTDGGMETTLIFHEGIDLPHFASFPLLETEKGRAIFENYYRPYIQIALNHGVGFLIDTPTWRCNRDWGALLGYSEAALAKVNTDAVTMLKSLREQMETPQTPIVINGLIGPRGDGYVPGDQMSADEAQAYHQPQIDTFAQSGADMVSALTLSYTNEAMGIARAAKTANIPVAIGFTVETDGQLATGQTLEQAITAVDQDTAPAYYIINCAHPTHFDKVVQNGANWTSRIHGIRSNSSSLSHEELDNSEALDSGNPQEFGDQHRALLQHLPNVKVIGGCCGTDHRHIQAIAETCAPN